jgi:hypothetical protein
MKCQYENCQDGHYPVGYHPAEYVSRDMALDAQDPSLEGSLYHEEEYEWGACPCCDGVNFENCPNCNRLADEGLL